MAGKWVSLVAVFTFCLVADGRASAQDFSIAAEPAKKKYDTKSVDSARKSDSDCSALG